MFSSLSKLGKNKKQTNKKSKPNKQKETNPNYPVTGNLHKAFYNENLSQNNFVPSSP